MYDLGTGDKRCPFCDKIIILGSVLIGNMQSHIDSCNEARKYKDKKRLERGE